MNGMGSVYENILKILVEIDTPQNLFYFILFQCNYITKIQNIISKTL